MEADPLCLVFIPALIVVLRAAEERKGSPTEAEVCRFETKQFASPSHSALRSIWKKNAAIQISHRKTAGVNGKKQGS